MGAKSVYLVVIDGGADWLAAKDMVVQKYPWIHFLHCVSHEASLIVKDICKIDEVADLLIYITDAQNWFSTHRLGSLLKPFCQEHYGCSKSFIWPAETRFAGKLLQLKRFYSMKAALQSCVQSAQYLRFDFVEDEIAPRITEPALWNKMNRIIKSAEPILLLLRLADQNTATLSKLKGTVDYISRKMIDSEDDTLESKISTAFHNRMPELKSDIASAAWVIEPQFVAKSRNAGSDVMTAFWTVCRKVLRCNDDAEWRLKRVMIVGELTDFRMKNGGFAAENYHDINTCSFWSVAGCHAPNLRQVAMCLASLPCSSGEAERNWFEVKLNKTKIRNRLSSDVLHKLVFVRRFIRLKQGVCNNESTTLLNEWSSNLLKEVAGESSSAVSSSDEDDDDNLMEMDVFHDSIQPGEQGRINGQEPGKPPVNLTELKKDNAARSWLFEKYYQVNFVDKNPEGSADDPPLEDESEWEHRIIKNIVWWRRKGHAVETALRGSDTNQSIVNYQINELLHSMIRDSPHNNFRLYSTLDKSTE